MLTHTYNPSYSEGRDWEDLVPGQPGKKVRETPISTKSKSCARWWWHKPVIPATGEAIGLALAKTQDTI
jgi:hypothetical protein